MINPNILPSVIDGKQGSLDLKMYVDDKVINVGIQLKDEGIFRNRLGYYCLKMYVDELKRGQEYEDLTQIITINILNFRLFDCDEPYSNCKLLETTRHEVLTDKCSIIFLN